MLKIETKFAKVLAAIGNTRQKVELAGLFYVLQKVLDTVIGGR